MVDAMNCFQTDPNWIDPHHKREKSQVNQARRPGEANKFYAYEVKKLPFIEISVKPELKCIIFTQEEQCEEESRLVVSKDFMKNWV